MVQSRGSAAARPRPTPCASGQPLPTLTKSRRTCAQQNDQHHIPQLHLGHGFVGRVAVDHQHHAGVGREVALGHVVAAGRVEAEDHRVLAQEHPQPPAIAPLAVRDDEDHPAGLVGLGECERGVPLEQGVVERLKQRLEAFQAAGHRAGRHVQAEQLPLAQQPFGRPVAEELVQEDLHPDRHAQPSLGDQLGGRAAATVVRGAVGAGARSLITPPSDAAAIGSDLDLDLFGILGVAGDHRRAAARAEASAFGQLADLLDDGQMAVSRRGGPGRSFRWPRLRGAAEGGPSRPRLRGRWSGPGGPPSRSCGRRVGRGACGFRRGVDRSRLGVPRSAVRPWRASPSSIRPAAAVRDSRAAGHRPPGATRSPHAGSVAPGRRDRSAPCREVYRQAFRP